MLIWLPAVQGSGNPCMAGLLKRWGTHPVLLGKMLQFKMEEEAVVTGWF